MSGYAFHAAPPPGEWFNDPNGLAHVGDAYCLFVQHAADSPAFARTGWARLSSIDLLNWHFDGPVLPADALGRRYSGSIVPGAAGLEAFLTLDDPDGDPRQRQVRALSQDGGATWSSALTPVGPAGRNVRDPFVWIDSSGVRRMLVAHPGDWAEAERGSRSFASLWTDAGGGDFVRTGAIGPWHPRGILWEVPAVIDFGATQALILSLVDRRNGATRCETRYWLGQVHEGGFTRLRGSPRGGRLLDHGPDFYAAIPNAPEGWRDDSRVIVAWAANWATARDRVLPGQGRGGPITLPRLVALARDRLHLAPLPAALPRAVGTWNWNRGEAWELSLVTRAGRWDFVIDRGRLTIVHDGQERTSALPLQGSGGSAALFVDGDLVELFAGGASFTLRSPLLDASALQMQTTSCMVRESACSFAAEA